VGGAKFPANELTVAVTDHTTVRAVFYSKVTGTADSGPESLREALLNAGDGGGIILSGQTIVLESGFTVSSSVVIEGNGAAIIRNGFFGPFLNITGTGTEARISRLHFRGARSTVNGGAIANAGILGLESCIFSDNQTTGNGGAVYTSGNLTVSACTFYGNRAKNNGGAIYRNGVSTLVLTGNVFWENTAASNSVVGVSTGSVTSSGFNVSDKAGGTTVTDSGWTFRNGDKKADVLPISSISFKPLGGGGAVSIFTSSLPKAYPALDFYGRSVQIPGAAGAVQELIEAAGFVLNYGSHGPGTVTIPPGTVDADGLVPVDGIVTLTASPAANGVFRYWTVDGQKQGEQSPHLTLNMDGHKSVRAVFYVKVTNPGNDGPGSLREALLNANDGPGVIFSVETVTLTGSLPEISVNFALEGNGAALTHNGFMESTTSQLLRITGSTTEVRISRLHFKEGRATNYGAAINNAGKLTLESCIFSENQTSTPAAYGGAIYSTGSTSSVTVSGCTFYGNSAYSSSNGQGGAIYAMTGTLTLVGNIFWGNTGSYPVVRKTSGTVTTNGYNVSDKAGGTGTGGTASGWTFKTGAAADVQLSGVSFDTGFKPSHGSLPVVPVSSLTGFPALYFDGTNRGTSSAPGAMPAQ
jgi:predicted outer membrane repeat protein